MTPPWLKRDYRAVSYTLVSCVVGLIFARLLLYFAALPDETYGQSLAENTLFTVLTQVVFFLAVPFAVYMLYGKRTVKQTLEFSSVGKFRAYYLLAVPLGIAVFIVTVGVSALWTALLKKTGYTVSSASTPMPGEFVFGFFLADVVLTAVLPAVCEEFCMRGGLLTTARNSFKTVWCVVICAVAFGLFHQNIRQVFYTSLFGGLAAFLVIRTKSLYPAMLMHFTNNFCSVFIDYADNYDWAVGGGFYDFMNDVGLFPLTLVFLAVAALGTVIVVLMLYINDKRVIAKKKEVLSNSAFDATGKRVVLMGEFDPERVEELEMEKEVYGKDYKRPLYKPTARDVMIPISLGVVALLTTVFTYVWGFFY